MKCCENEDVSDSSQEQGYQAPCAQDDPVCRVDSVGGRGRGVGEAGIVEEVEVEGCSGFM